MSHPLPKQDCETERLQLSDNDLKFEAAALRLDGLLTPDSSMNYSHLRIPAAPSLPMLKDGDEQKAERASRESSLCVPVIRLRRAAQ